MATNYKAVTTKGVLFGYEKDLTDLACNKYAVVTFPQRGPIRADIKKLNDGVNMYFNTLPEAVAEAEACVVEQGRKFNRYVTYAVRVGRMCDVEAFELMGVSEKIKAEKA